MIQIYFSISVSSKYWLKMLWLDIEQQLACEHNANLDKFKEDEHKFETNEESRFFVRILCFLMIHVWENIYTKKSKHWIIRRYNILVLVWGVVWSIVCFFVLCECLFVRDWNMGKQVVKILLQRECVWIWSMWKFDNYNFCSIRSNKQHYYSN